MKPSLRLGFVIRDADTVRFILPSAGTDLVCFQWAYAIRPYILCVYRLHAVQIKSVYDAKTAPKSGFPNLTILFCLSTAHITTVWIFNGAGEFRCFQITHLGVCCVCFWLGFIVFF